MQTKDDAMNFFKVALTWKVMKFNENIIITQRDALKTVLKNFCLLPRPAKKIRKSEKQS